ncbi:MAG TPA: TolC family protein [Pirellulales bacterium]|nr:TolC family protein [Pirellulales bacterium]
MLKNLLRFAVFAATLAAFVLLPGRLLLSADGQPPPQRRSTGYLPLDRWRSLQQAMNDRADPALPQAPPENDERSAPEDEVDRTQQVISRLHHLGGRPVKLPLVDKKYSPASQSYLPLQRWNASQAEQQPVAPNPPAADDMGTPLAAPNRRGPALVPQTAMPAGPRVIFRGDRSRNSVGPDGQARSVVPEPVTPAGATDAGTPATNASLRVRQPRLDAGEESVDALPEPLPEINPSRPPGSRTRAETVDAPSAIPLPENEYFIDLETVIRLVASGNPTVAIAREEVREMLALQTRANSMLLPSLNAGASLHEHQGNFQASTGQIKYIYSKSLYYGGGTRAWAAEAPAVPMVRLFSHLGDAIFEPLAVRQQVSSRRFNSTATSNTILLESVMRYFDLLGAEGRLQAARETERETAEIVRITASYALTGQGREGDANRARTEAYLMHTEVQRAEEREALAAAKLSEILSLEPTVRLHTVGGPIGGLEIIDANTELQTLIRMAERRRPELAAGSANIQHNMTRLRQEKTRPLFPMVMLGYSAASFGGGGVLFPPFFGTFRGRQDFDALAVWSLTNMGVGNAATVSERRAVLNQSLAERNRALNGVRQEVIAAYGLVHGERLQIQITQRQLADTEEGFREEFRRLLGAEALPIEVLNSVDQLGVARQELIKAVTGYNQAQFRLYVATGMSPTRAVQTASAGK